MLITRGNAKTRHIAQCASLRATRTSNMVTTNSRMLKGEDRGSEETRADNVVDIEDMGEGIMVHGTNKETDGTDKETDGTDKATNGTAKATNGTVKTTKGTDKQIIK